MDQQDSRSPKARAAVFLCHLVGGDYPHLPPAILCVKMRDRCRRIFGSGGMGCELDGILDAAAGVFLRGHRLVLLEPAGNQQTSRTAIDRESRKELEKLQQIAGHLPDGAPVGKDAARPRFDEIIGQEEGVQALAAALCGPNPQHVIIYGPPGVGKTAAARLVLEEAKKNPLSPFNAGRQIRGDRRHHRPL